MIQTPSLTPAETARYSRHIMLSEIGLGGQLRLKRARVLVIGAGGLGSPVALYLAAAGVGTIGLADFDKVEAHNLQRQILHTDASVGHPKTESGAAQLRAINPGIEIVQHRAGVTAENAVALFRDYDLIVDGSDNFPTRYLNTDAAFLAGKPLVYGSIFKFEGQVTVFDPHGGTPCYRCLFPEPPPPGSVPNCGEAGVLGALCGVVGSIQAMEAVKRLAGIREGLAGRLLVIDAMNMTFRSLNLRKDPDCPLCGPRAAIHVIDPARYAEGCAPGTQPADAASTTTAAPIASAPPDEELPLEIDVETASSWLRSGHARLLDVREPFELGICAIAGAEHIPMRQVPGAIEALAAENRPLLVLCHHGGRSMQVTQFLRSRGMENVSNIAGGIDAWAVLVEPGMQRY
ncbi:molybdopterin-synthase adenylyltransferase MoeB [Opitutales bacterium ASA1]|uniref:HesA/MoeB/ThiF family protein n=1 Tax=Congregicoccus parvus TaxID=3081749 RepID=UPI002B2EFA46|nr:molybdopterin-synthase adenylyltransferase MoeB [Opitutales bacterium ASA1]